MEIILAYLSVFALMAAVAGLFIPHRMVFWVGREDRSRAMAFTVYLTAAVVLAVTFVAVVPEPAPRPMPAVEDVVETVPPAPLTEPVFLAEVKARLAKGEGFRMDSLRFSLLDFGKTGATAQLRFTEKPHRKVAVEHATAVVRAMVETLKAHGWELTSALLLECQVHTDEVIYTGDQAHRSMGFARYRPDTGKITWLDFNG